MKRVVFLTLFITLVLLATSALAQTGELHLTLEKVDFIATAHSYEIYDDGDTTYIVLFGTFSSKSNESSAFYTQFGFEVFQGGIECSSTYVSSKYGSANTTTNIKNKASIEVYSAFELHNKYDDVEVTLKPWITFSSENNKTATIKLYTSNTDDAFSLRKGIMWGMSDNDVRTFMYENENAIPYMIQDRSDIEHRLVYKGVSVSDYKCDMFIGIRSDFGVYYITYMFDPDLINDASIGEEYSLLYRAIVSVYGEPNGQQNNFIVPPPEDEKPTMYDALNDDNLNLNMYWYTSDTRVCLWYNNSAEELGYTEDPRNRYCIQYVNLASYGNDRVHPTPMPTPNVEGL